MVLAVGRGSIALERFGPGGEARMRLRARRWPGVGLGFADIGRRDVLGEGGLGHLPKRTVRRGRARGRVGRA